MTPATNTPRNPDQKEAPVAHGYEKRYTLSGSRISIRVFTFADARRELAKFQAEGADAALSSKVGSFGPFDVTAWFATSDVATSAYGALTQVPLFDVQIKMLGAWQLHYSAVPADEAEVLRGENELHGFPSRVLPHTGPTVVSQPAVQGEGR